MPHEIQEPHIIVTSQEKGAGADEFAECGIFVLITNKFPGSPNMDFYHRLDSLFICLEANDDRSPVLVSLRKGLW